MDSEYYSIEEKGFNDTIVIFSSINTIPGRFRFDRMMKGIKANVIYLNCEANSWYLNGIPGLGYDLTSSRVKLKKIISERFPGTNIFAFGSSMGASGMIAMMPDINVKNAFAFCPEIELFRPSSFSKHYFKNYTGSVKDLWSEINDFDNLHVFYGEECEVDLYQLSKVKSKTKFGITTFAHEGHGALEAVYLTEGINRVINALINCRRFIPNVIELGNISGSAVTCDVIYRAHKSLSSDVNDVGALGALKRVIDITKKERTYYPLLKYWEYKITEDQNTRVNAIKEAMNYAPTSIRIAQLYYSIFNNEKGKENFKTRWREKFGEKYANHSRAKSLNEI